MRLLDDLRSEHELIEAVLGSLRTYVERRIAGQADPADGARFLSFFRLWAGHYHHAREEGVLFPALVEEAGLPGARGPIAILEADHRRMADLLERLAPLLTGAALEGARAEQARELATAYSRALWHHIDAENSVLFPESEHRLVRAGVAELPAREPTAEELAARDEGLALRAAYAPLRDAGIVRGEGCPSCPAFGSPCDGIEREWWDEAEWDEFPDHVG